MENDLKFKFEIKLQRLSIISLAEYLWRLPAIKEEISSFFKLHDIFTSRCKNWGQVVEKVFNVFKLMANEYVPAHLKNELNDGIINMGERILHWVIYLTEDLNLDFSYAEDIYFTYYGVIDEEKIFQLSWEKNVEITDGSATTAKTDRLPCMYVREDFIEKNKDIMITWQMCYPASDECEDQEVIDINIIITAGICSYINSKRSHFVIPQPYRNMIKKFTNRGVEIKPKDMFQISIACGLHKAVNYFLGKLDEFTIEKEIPAALDLCFKMIKKPTKNLLYLKEKYIEILLNLLNRLPENERSSFILKNQGALLLLLLNWPFQNFYIFVLDKTAKTLSNADCNSVVLRLTHYIVSDCRSQCEIKRHIYKILLQMTWCRIDDRKKGCIHRQVSIVSRLFTYKQFSILRILINIRNLPDGLEFNKLAVHWRLLTCIKSGKYDVFNKFVTEVFSSADEVEIFKIKMMDCFDVLLQEELFRRADQFLDWLASADKDRQFYKNQIDNLGILRTLITKRKLASAERFLNWRFDTIAERKNYKKLLRSDEVIQAKINEVVIEPDDGDMSFNLLEWLGNPEKEDT